MGDVLNNMCLTVPGGDIDDGVQLQIQAVPQSGKESAAVPDDEWSPPWTAMALPPSHIGLSPRFHVPNEKHPQFKSSNAEQHGCIPTMSTDRQRMARIEDVQNCSRSMGCGFLWGYSNQECSTAGGRILRKSCGGTGPIAGMAEVHCQPAKMLMAGQQHTEECVGAAQGGSNADGARKETKSLYAPRRMGKEWSASWGLSCAARNQRWGGCRDGWRYWEATREACTSDANDVRWLEIRPSDLNKKWPRYVSQDLIICASGLNRHSSHGWLCDFK
ncbi:hypothetical protein B0H14DRAFT_2591787 [Mycena olivaceomarginata]|nr:hypothetical protein B0H14DRAFT_2591787 [Mycena olivaceomarginata]